MAIVSLVVVPSRSVGSVSALSALVGGVGAVSIVGTVERMGILMMELAKYQCMTAASVDDVDARVAAAMAQDVPYNAVTGATYRGKNIGRLVGAEVDGGYGPGGWAGFQQWLTVDRVVRKGEHGTACVTVMVDKTEDGEPSKSRGVRGFRVFHYDQTTELDEVTS